MEGGSRIEGECQNSSDTVDGDIHLMFREFCPHGSVLDSFCPNRRNNI